MTETCAAYIVSGPRDHVIPEEFAGAHGFPVRFMEYRIVDLETGEPVAEGAEGEICVRGYSLMLGMYKRERHEIVDDDGWYHTGDKGMLRGPYIFFTGRTKDLIKASGANVAPREVEFALGSIPEVLTSVVVGVPDPERGEVVAAVLVPRVRDGFDPVAVIAQAGQALSSYKIPRRYLVLDSDDLPLLATGKPDLAALRALLVTSGRSTTAV
jgi:acyl-CoA synthetase (AMP-forming)/AMP-acid ligase II